MKKKGHAGKSPSGFPIDFFFQWRSPVYYFLNVQVFIVDEKEKHGYDIITISFHFASNYNVLDERDKLISEGVSTLETA